jgi:hypothetical protein
MAIKKLQKQMNVCLQSHFVNLTASGQKKPSPPWVWGGGKIQAHLSFRPPPLPSPLLLYLFDFRMMYFSTRP